MNNENMPMQIYSGSCCLCDIGTPTNENDMHGAELFTGDIVQLWHGNYIGTDFEEWMPSSGLTAIVSSQYQSYSDGAIKALKHESLPFTMGIRSDGVQGSEWRVSLVKSHADVINGERFPAFGMSYKNPTESLLAALKNPND